MKIPKLNEVTGEIEMQDSFECAHCDEPSERANSFMPTCHECKRPICPCCDVHNCQNN